jgi:hypothetical protein
MTDKQIKYKPTGENAPMPISDGIVFEVQRIHRNPDPPVRGMMVFLSGNGVKNR